MSKSPVFAFSKQNYILILVGIVIIVFGFILMSGGGSDDPNVFKGDYTLTDESFEKMTNDYFKVEAGIADKLKPIQNKVFSSELELETEIEKLLGASFKDNYYSIRSATQIDGDIFSTRRLTIAPMVVLLGYIGIFIGIMRKPESVEDLIIDDSKESSII